MLIRWEWVPYNKRKSGYRHIQREGGAGEDSEETAQERGLRSNQPCPHQDLRLQPPGLGEINVCCLGPQILVLCYGSSRKIIQLFRPLIVTDAFLKTGGVVFFPPRSVFLRFRLGWFQFWIKNTRPKQNNNKSKKKKNTHTQSDLSLVNTPIWLLHHPPTSSVPKQRMREVASVWAGESGKSRLKNSWAICKN